MLLWFMAIFLVLLLLNWPVYTTFYLAAIFALLVYLENIPLEIVVQTSFNTVNVYVLIAVPYFIFAASVISRGGLAKRLVEWAMSIVGSIKGSLGVATILAACVFSAISGSSPATVAALGKILYPSLLASKYRKTFTLGLVTVLGGIDLLIPPSITMIVYGSIANVSVGKLFIAGVVPGLLVGLIYSIYVIGYAMYDKVPTAGRFDVRKVVLTTRQGFWTLGVPVVILGGIYTGIFTPTESAAIASVYSLFIAAVLYREIGLKQIWEIGVETAELTAQIFIIVAASGIFSWLLTIGHAPQILSDLVVKADLPYWALLMGINSVLLVAGMFMHPTSITIIFTPLLMPIITALGVDPIHFGIILTANIAIGMYTPPFGLNLFVSIALFKEPMAMIVRGVIPFLIMTMGILVLLTFVPWFSMWLPNMMK